MTQRPDDSRRRFIKAGLRTAPVIVTLSARPAWAQEIVTNGTLGNYGSSGEGLTGTQQDPFAPQPATITTTEEPSLF
jgi:hypothetical protein